MGDVVIEMAATDRASPLAPTLVKSCSDAVPEGRCVLADESTSSRPNSGANAAAIVVWEGTEHRVARVEVGLPGSARAEWLSRAIEFNRKDDAAERWRAVGLVIATLVGEKLRPPAEKIVPAAPAAVEAPPRAPPPSTHPPISDSPRPRERLWIEAGAMAAPGLEGGSWRAGAWARAAYRPWPLPLYGVTSVRYLATPRDGQGVAAQWFSPSVGFGVVGSLGDWRLLAHVDLAAQWTHASVEKAGASDGASRWVTLARAGADCAYMPLSWVGVVGGAEVFVASSGTRIFVHGNAVARDAPFGVAFLLGPRFVLP